MRKKLWQLHSWIGLFCGLALVIIGLTGSVLVFHQEIANSVYPEETLNSSTAPNAQRLPIDRLCETVESKFPEFWIRGWLFNYDSPQRDKAYVMRHGEEEWYLLYVDPYTAATSHAPIKTDQTIYGWFVDLHYTFFADHIGMAIAGIFALGFLFLSVSGFYLHKPFFKALFRLRIRASSRIFFSDLHKAIGIVTIPMNFIFGFTGAYWNITHLVHEIIEHSEEDHDHLESEYPAYRERIAELPDLADTTLPGYSLNYIYFPREEEPMFYLYGQHPGAGVFNSPYGSHIWVDAISGEVTYMQDLRKAHTWTKIADTFEPLHFGNFGGLTTKILWCIAGFSPAALCITGTIMYFKRGRRKARKHKTHFQTTPSKCASS
ncbi:PepSY-associated TM helix domain-containing protein [Pelagicoccus mobilis]|uniref:PepSY domain-containing protein n=1 Tax=Pelagicoccus mobilis TaxID=415221 RepID=A0A934VS67_9BACT|nr:PepSY-associated TM helix domain-containing protein [Pelagicoccus mobilis]MBK1878348.1 PepSY domain-containing protein [Pelagicoccus mobilis]